MLEMTLICEKLLNDVGEDPNVLKMAQIFGIRLKSVGNDLDMLETA